MSRWREKKPENELQRNCCTIRLSDQQFNELAEFCYRNRTSVSRLVREIIVEHLKQKGVAV